MHAHIARTEPPADNSDHSLDVVEAALQRAGVPTRHLPVPAAGLPRGTRPINFKATAPVLEESWRVARHLEASTSPGDLVIVSDRHGVGAVFAWEQATAPPQRARRLGVVAADSLLLGGLAVAGTSRGFGTEDVVALEASSYRFAEYVLATSEWAVQQLHRLGDKVQVAAATYPAIPAPPGPAGFAWMPEPVGRDAQTRTVLSALVAGGARVAVCDRDEDDRFWKGSTWETLEPLVSRFGDRLVRTADPPADVDTVVLGSLTRVPDLESVLTARGIRLVVPAGSTAAALRLDADTWEDQRSLIETLAYGRSESRSLPPLVLEESEQRWRPDRAQRVSVGIPIHRTIEYLDECLESILGQTQQPAEVLLYDDGSESDQVTAALERWGRRAPSLIRVMDGPNLGVCVARNRMLEAMSGDAFLLVDSDDRLAPSFVEECADGLRADPNLAAISTWTEFFGEYEGVEARRPFDAASAWDENPIISTCALVDMSVRDRGIRFSPDLAWIYCEDWEFWAKILAAGGRFGLVPRPLAFHRAAPATGGGYRRTELAYTVGRERARRYLRRVLADELVP